MKLGYSDAMAVINKALDNIKTNIPMNEAISLASYIIKQGGVSAITTAQMPFDGTWNYAYVQPAGYTGKMAVTKIDIPENRKRVKALLY